MIEHERVHGAEQASASYKLQNMCFAVPAAPSAFCVASFQQPTPGNGNRRMTFYVNPMYTHAGSISGTLAHARARGWLHPLPFPVVQLQQPANAPAHGVNNDEPLRPQEEWAPARLVEVAVHAAPVPPAVEANGVAVVQEPDSDTDDCELLAHVRRPGGEAFQVGELITQPLSTSYAETCMDAEQETKDVDDTITITSSRPGGVAFQVGSPIRQSVKDYLLDAWLNQLLRECCAADADCDAHVCVVEDAADGQYGSVDDSDNGDNSDNSEDDEDTPCVSPARVTIAMRPPVAFTVGESSFAPLAWYYTHEQKMRELRALQRSCEELLAELKSGLMLSTAAQTTEQQEEEPELVEQEHADSECDFSNGDDTADAADADIDSDDADSDANNSDIGTMEATSMAASTFYYQRFGNSAGALTPPSPTSPASSSSCSSRRRYFDMWRSQCFSAMDMPYASDADESSSDDDNENEDIDFDIEVDGKPAWVGTSLYDCAHAQDKGQETISIPMSQTPWFDYYGLDPDTVQTLLDDNALFPANSVTYHVSEEYGQYDDAIDNDSYNDIDDDENDNENDAADDGEGTTTNPSSQTAQQNVGVSAKDIIKEFLIGGDQNYLYATDANKENDVMDATKYEQLWVMGTLNDFADSSSPNPVSVSDIDVDVNVDVDGGVHLNDVNVPATAVTTAVSLASVVPVDVVVAELTPCAVTARAIEIAPEVQHVTNQPANDAVCVLSQTGVVDAEAAHNPFASPDSAVSGHAACVAATPVSTTPTEPLVLTPAAASAGAAADQTEQPTAAAASSWLPGWMTLSGWW